jgi:twitching motility two-component system response regulator PilG
VSQVSAISLLRDGIAAAKAGDKALTRRLLREAVYLEPENEVAWLWLAGVAESPQDALVSLERVLEINPNNERAREGLKSARLQAGVAEAKAGNKAAARPLLKAVVDQEPTNELAWLWLAGVAESPQGMMSSLQRVLDINPKNERAREGMRSARLQFAIAEAKAGNKATAREHIFLIIEQEPGNELAWQWLAAVAPSNEKALAAWQTVLELNPNNKRAQEAIRYYDAKEIALEDTAETEAPPRECPLCAASAGEAASQCGTCGGVLSLADLDAVMNNGAVHHALMKNAIERYETAVRQQPDFASHYYLGLAHLNLNNLESALTHLSNAMRIKPRDQVLSTQVGVLSQRFVALKAAEVEKTRKEHTNQGSVLIVDDSATVRKLVSMTMEKSGYSVSTAADGYEAADHILKNIPDLILLDVAMPGMDGYQVCKLIKENKETAKIPVIMLSGKDGFFDKIRGRMAGSTAYITKPFKPEALVQVVKKHCQPRKKL